MSGFIPGAAMVRRLAAIVPLLVVWTLAGCTDEEEAAAQPAPPPPPAVTVAPVRTEALIEYTEFTGRFEPIETVEVRARVSGYLQSIGFEDGAMVEAGQVLFVIDPRPYQAAVEEARAQLASAEARVALADAELRRAEQLVSRETVSRSTYDQRVQEKRVAEATAAMAEATLAQAELDLSFTEVRSPIAGRISSRRVDAGNLVTGDPDATLLTTIVALDPIYFAFDMSEAEFLAYQRAVAEGRLASTRDRSMAVQVRLPDEPDGPVWPHPGTMHFVDNQVDPNSGTIRGRAVLANRDLFITPGQFGRLRLPSSHEYEAILVPDGAIMTDQANRIVMVVNADDVAEPRVVRPGPSRPGGLRIVRAGLQPGDRIIINGLMRVRPGMPVDPQPGTIEPQLESAALN